jgi:hypothetical protein
MGMAKREDLGGLFGEASSRRKSRLVTGMSPPHGCQRGYRDLAGGDSIGQSFYSKRLGDFT